MIDSICKTKLFHFGKVVVIILGVPITRNVLVLETDVRVATVRENIWKMTFFQGQGKVREFYGWPGKFRKDLESQGKVREFENKWL